MCSSLYIAELQSIRAANYDQHSADEAISSTQTQLHTSRPRRNEHVFVYLKNKGAQKGRTQAEPGGRVEGTNEEHMKDSWKRLEIRLLCLLSRPGQIIVQQTQLHER